MKKSAIISPCKNYRYKLERTWDESLPTIHWIMLNPSLANAIDDDPTLRRVIIFSRLWGFGSLVVLNLFAFISSEPNVLRNMKNEAKRIGPQNDDYFSFAKAPIVAAWGAQRFAKVREAEVMKLLPVPVLCLGMTKDGSPRHPLYVSHATSPIHYLPPILES